MISSISLVPYRFSARPLLTPPKSRSITSAPSCRTGRISCRYTVSVTWLLAWPASRAIFSIAMPSPDSSETNVCRRSRGAQSLPSPALSQTVLEHLPDVPCTQRCTGGRGEHPAGVLPTRSGSLPLSRLVRLPFPERPGGHLRQLQRAAGPRGLGVSSGPVRAQHCDRRRIAVQVDVLLPPNRPGFLRAHPQPSGSPRCRHASARPGAADPSALRAAPVPVVPAVGARRALVVEGDAAMAPGQPSPVREHAPVVPGCGYRASDLRFKKAI